MLDWNVKVWDIRRKFVIYVETDTIFSFSNFLIFSEKFALLNVAVIYEKFTWKFLVWKKWLQAVFGMFDREKDEKMA